MPQNPLYDPDWPARLAQAEAALRAAQQAADAAAGWQFAGPAHRAALAHLGTAQMAQRAAWRAQFCTVADYARWRLEDVELPRDGFALARDAEDFVSLDEVDAAYERARIHRREGTLEQNFRLSVGQPMELAAFAEPERVLSSWRRFGETECMVSYHEEAGFFHICLAHPWGALARQANERFRFIATRLARESIGLMLPGADVIFEEGRHKLVQHRELIRGINACAAKFRFYRHLLPERQLREEFCRVDMGWNGISFIDPDWSARVYGCLPLALRAAAGQPMLPALPGATPALEAPFTPAPEAPFTPAPEAPFTPD